VHLAARVTPPGLTVEIVDWIDQLPYYNPDFELELPDVARRWRQLITEADAIVIGMPEYNYGPSAVAKNAIDWLSRPPAERVLQGKVIALVTSGGKGGGSKVQAAIGPILGLLGNTVIDEPPVQIALGANRISGDGQTDDEEIIDLVTRKMANLALALVEAASTRSE
jgi:chromate reductase, NAD(P)H dehydrogenase (quinone)